VDRLLTSRLCMGGLVRLELRERGDGTVFERTVSTVTGYPFGVDVEVGEAGKSRWASMEEEVEDKPITYNIHGSHWPKEVCAVQDAHDARQREEERAAEAEAEAREKACLSLVAAINAMGCEWQASYEHPGYCSVYPREESHGVYTPSWAFGYENGIVRGNDEHVGNSDEVFDSEHIEGDYGNDAIGIVAHMRRVAIRRVGYLTDFAERASDLLEKTVATSPDMTTVMGKPAWWNMSPLDSYTKASSLVNEWRQR
jgi:hypothetical protein